MDLTTLLAGVGIGLFLAAPVGPIALTCIRHTLAGGLVSGLAAGLGAATSHALLSGLVGVGATQLAGWAPVLQVIGGLVLLRLAWKACRARPDPRGETGAREGARAAYLRTVLLQLATPANTILALLAYVSGLSGDGGASALGWLTAGVFLGSALWWTALITAVSWLRQRMTTQRLVWLNRCSGVLIFIFAVRLLWAGAAHYGIGVG